MVQPVPAVMDNWCCYFEFTFHSSMWNCGVLLHWSWEGVEVTGMIGEWKLSSKWWSGVEPSASQKHTVLGCDFRGPG